MSGSNQNIRGIHYEISKPKLSPYDGHYHQRVRQVDEYGNLVGIGEESHKSPAPGSTDGLFVPSIDPLKLGKAAVHLLKMFGGTRGIATGGAELAHDLYSGLSEGYKDWPGTHAPWEPIFNWRTGGLPVDFVHGRGSGGLGDGNGIGSWSDVSSDFPQGRPRYDWESTAQGFENVPVPDLAPRARKSEWNGALVRDSAAAAGVPSRNNVYEYGFPEPGSVQPLMTPGATRSAGYLGGAVAPPIPFVPVAPRGVSGGLPGLLSDVGLNDPLNPYALPSGGLVGLIQEYLRDNAPGSN